MQETFLLGVHVGPYWQHCTVDSCCTFCCSTIFMAVFYSSTLRRAYCWRSPPSTKNVL